MLRSQVWGQIKCNSRLTGTFFLPFHCPNADAVVGNPDLLLTFTNPRIMDNCSFHPCVRYVPSFRPSDNNSWNRSDRYKKWNKDHVLSFIPPDGHFDLLRYEAVQPSVKGVGAASKGFPLPLVFKPELKLEEAGGTFRPLPKIADHGL